MTNTDSYKVVFIKNLFYNDSLRLSLITEQHKVWRQKKLTHVDRNLTFYIECVVDNVEGNDDTLVGWSKLIYFIN